ASNIVKVKAKPTEAIENSENPITNSYIDLDKLPEDYSYELAIKNGDVVNFFHKNYNVEKFIEFMAAFESKKLNPGDMIRITFYTVEGDAIISDLIFTEDGIKLVRDNTRDKYASQANRKRTTYNVVDIRTIKAEDRTFYRAITDTGEEIPIFAFKNDYLEH
ncbi:MAG: DUF4362 domain-containing protein, partial [Clostridium sp.]